ncbi:EAL domain-containing protein [Solirubrobacter phytolaccae]|uniref:EAL domain-containing protein n=1 Tax=Solirubrobacter phytolaccae TaxID=1404360 RepID=A0A9X3SBN3_9ACTN|nr:EAL domain-containing protein [Solirubrobacter phytolaccae]MDA0181610.1 EAL domain-containing protein [Solirubrobacter phytolaccae]
MSATLIPPPAAEARPEASVFWRLSSDLLCIADQDGRLLDANPAWELLLGYSREELSKLGLLDLIHSDDHEEARVHFRAHTTGTAGAWAEVEPLEVRCRRADGTFRWLRWTGYADGERIYAAGTDVTERKSRAMQVQRERESALWYGRCLEALDDDRFELHAQPIVDVVTGLTVQHELLIRMRDRNGALVPPGLFLPAAEQHGIIAEIDRWVITQAARIARAGHPVEINLSAHSLGDPSLYGFVARQLAAVGAEPSLIVFEITETALLKDEAAACVFVERVKRLGCRVALDDFGTGYGGFTYLKRLPVDYLKIDIDFVRDLPQNPASQHVVRAVVSLARGFGQKTVAEGVEDAETLALLCELGVDYGQGYHIGRPAPLSDTLRYSAR